MELLEFILMMFVQLGIAVYAAAIAPRVDRNKVAWFLLSLIPVFGFLFVYYIWYRITVTMLDRLNVLHARASS